MHRLPELNPTIATAEGDPRPKIAYFLNNIAPETHIRQEKVRQTLFFLGIRVYILHDLQLFATQIKGDFSYAG